jgi:hypothetical protein
MAYDNYDKPESQQRNAKDLHHQFLVLQSELEWKVWSIVQYPHYLGQRQPQEELSPPFAYLPAFPDGGPATSDLAMVP